MAGRTSELTRRAGAAAPAAYESYYGFAEPPFSLSPGVRFTFRSRAYGAALDEVQRALQRREGLIVVTGDIGTGKTMLCRTIMQECDAKTFVSLVLDPCVSAEELLARMLRDFGVLDLDERTPRLIAAPPRHQLLVVLQRRLALLGTLGGRAVVIIDEAQHLHPAVLEQIRLWSNLEGDEPARLQIVLAGQPELEALLNRPDLRQVRQRVARRCHLTRLRRSEVAQYLEHRLTVARGPAGEPARPAGVLAQAHVFTVRFTPAGARRVAALTRGIPRLVNLIADRALEIGCERRAHRIDQRIVRDAARRLNLLAPALPRIALRVAAAAVAVVMIGGAGVWRSAAPVPDVVPVRTLEVQESVSLSVASFRTEQRAAAVTAQLVDGGFPAFTRRDPGGLWHQIIVGPYVSPEEATAAQRALQAQGVEGTEVRLERVAVRDVSAAQVQP